MDGRTASNRKCSAPDCDQKHLAKGYCEFHYYRHARGVDLAVPRHHKRTKCHKERLREGSSVDANGCWLWQGRLDHGGYGIFNYGSRQTSASRAAYRAFVGEVPSGLLVCHTCDVRACCNPDHLFLGTYTDNMADMIAKGRDRHQKGERAGRAVLRNADVLAIRAAAAAGETQTKLAARFGVAQTQVSRIVRGEVWRHI